MKKTISVPTKHLRKGAIEYELTHTCRYTVEIPGERVVEATKFVETLIKEKNLFPDLVNSVGTSKIDGSQNVKFSVVSETGHDSLVELMQDHMRIIGKTVEDKYFPMLRSD